MESLSTPRRYVAPGATIRTQPGFVRGHGTMLTDDGKLIATVAGIVERVNKLVVVRPINSRYSPEIGDVVVGRVLEIASKRWRLDINSRQHASLLLSAVNLPGGVQRRRTAADELAMASLFSPGDLVSAEVQELRHDGGAIMLHTRSLKYGALGRPPPAAEGEEDGEGEPKPREVGRGGVVVRVRCALVKRARKHFVEFPGGVKAVLGVNGYIWLACEGGGGVEEKGEGGDEAMGDDGEDGTEEEENRRRAVFRIRAAIEALDKAFIQISEETVTDVLRESIQNGFAVADMLRPENLDTVTASARARRAMAL